jgi:hypothetical protein
MHQDEELHEQLMEAFRQYFKANQNWITKQTKRGAMDTRFWLSEIRRICSARRKHIMDWRYEKNIDMANKKAQKRQKKASDNAN